MIHDRADRLNWVRVRGLLCMCVSWVFDSFGTLVLLDFWLVGLWVYGSYDVC